MPRRNDPGAPIVMRSYDLCAELYQHVNRFPRAQRGLLGRVILDEALRMLAALTLANRLGNKTEALSEASGHLDALRIALRLAKRLTFLPKRAYAALSETIDEVGRMLGGWLKHEQANPQGEESSEPAGAESSKGKKPESRKRIFGVADLWGRVLFHAFTCKCLKQEPILLLPQLKRPSIRRNRND